MREEVREREKLISQLCRYVLAWQVNGMTWEQVTFWARLSSPAFAELVCLRKSDTPERVREQVTKAIDAELSTKGKA